MRDKTAQIHTNTQRKVIVTSYALLRMDVARPAVQQYAASQRLSSHRRVHNKLSRCCTIWNYYVPLLFIVIMNLLWMCCKIIESIIKALYNTRPLLVDQKSLRMLSCRKCSSLHYCSCLFQFLPVKFSLTRDPLPNFLRPFFFLHFSLIKHTNDARAHTLCWFVCNIYQLTPTILTVRPVYCYSLA